MNLAYKISSDIKIHKVYFPYVSPITASSVECFTIIFPPIYIYICLRVYTSKVSNQTVHIYIYIYICMYTTCIRHVVDFGLF